MASPYTQYRGVQTNRFPIEGYLAGGQAMGAGLAGLGKGIGKSTGTVVCFKPDGGFQSTGSPRQSGGRYGLTEGHAAG